MHLFGIKEDEKKKKLVLEEDLEIIVDRVKNHSDNVRIDSSGVSVVVPRGKGSKSIKGRKSIKHHFMSINSLVKARRSRSSEADSLPASLIDPKTIYRFRLVNTGTLSSSAGTWLGYFNLDPTAVTEWSSISALFNEYRLDAAKVTFVPMIVNSLNPAFSAPRLMVNIDLGVIGSSPANIGVVAENPNSKYLGLCPGMPYDNYSIEVKGLSNDFNWQIASASGTPYAGWYGECQFAGTSANTADSVAYMLELVVQVRSRT